MHTMMMMIYDEAQFDDGVCLIKDDEIVNRGELSMFRSPKSMMTEV